MTAPAAVAGSSTTGHPAPCATMEATAKPTATPMAPPPVHKATASITNWVRMSRGLAPIASRSPISRVRSVTDTSMMFIMPIPPTISETQATAASRAETVRVDASCAATMEAAVATLNPLSSSWTT